MMSSKSPHQITNYLRQTLRKQHIEGLFRQKRLQLMDREMKESIHQQREVQINNILQQLCRDLSNINNLSMLYNYLHQGEHIIENNAQTQIILERIIEEVQYWITMRQLKQHCQAFLFLLILILKYLATFTPAATHYIKQLATKCRVLDGDSRVKQLLLMDLTHIKAIQYS